METLLAAAAALAVWWRGCLPPVSPEDVDPKRVLAPPPPPPPAWVTGEKEEEVAGRGLGVMRVGAGPAGPGSPPGPAPCLSIKLRLSIWSFCSASIDCKRVTCVRKRVKKSEIRGFHSLHVGMPLLFCYLISQPVELDGKGAGTEEPSPGHAAARAVEVKLQLSTKQGHTDC